MDQVIGSDSENESRKVESKKKRSSKSKKEGRSSTSAKDVSSKRESSKSAPSSASDQQLTLWDLAIKATTNSQDTEIQAEEKSILFVGSKDSGKTTMVMRFLDRDEAPKPTTSLEYTFGRRAKSNNLDKDIAHIWELGGGTWLSKLTDIVISGDSIKNLAVALVLDLSKPDELWFTLDRWLEVLRTRVSSALQEIKESALLVRERMNQDSWNRIGDEHVDRDMLDPFLIPFVIVGSKYDVFQDFDPETRKVICKTLRFVAHRNGAHLVFFSAKQEALVTRVRSVISNLVFATPLSKSSQTDHNKPLFVTAGQDTFQQIGSPPVPEGDLGRISAKTPMDLWKHAFVAKFPQQNLADPSRVEDPAKDKQYNEPAVDAMRVQKDEELERYRRASERRAREALNKSLVDAFVY